MIAGALVAMTAVAVYPIFFRTKAASKLGDARQICENIVRGKLDQYRNGLPVDLSDARLRPVLKRLTLPQAPEALHPGGDPKFGGFFYAKYKYNQFVNADGRFSYCTGKSRANLFELNSDIVPDLRRVLGRRECLESDRSWEEGVEPPVDCKVDSRGMQLQKGVDSEISHAFPGFRLYVRISSDSSWPLSLTGDSGGRAEIESRFGLLSIPGFPDASKYRLTDPEPVHDFLGAGEGIKVTVTGIMDTLAGGAAGERNQKEHLGISTRLFDRFICSGSVTLRSELSQFRYYLSQDRRIYPESGLDLGSRLGAPAATEDKKWPFYSFYGDGTHEGSGILSFAVHPRNVSVWILKSGQLVRYSDCGGVPISCNLQSDTNYGVTDRGNLGGLSVQHFALPDSSIQSIGVDFRRGRVFGANGNLSKIVEVVGPNGEPLFDLEDGGDGQQVKVIPLEPSGPRAPGFVWTEGSIPNRLRAGFFLAPEGDQGFIADYSGTQVLGYNTAVYSLSDTQLLRPVIRLPVTAYGFSR